MFDFNINSILIFLIIFLFVYLFLLHYVPLSDLLTFLFLRRKEKKLYKCEKCGRYIHHNYISELKAPLIEIDPKETTLRKKKKKVGIFCKICNQFTCGTCVSWTLAFKAGRGGDIKEYYYISCVDRTCKDLRIKIHQEKIRIKNTVLVIESLIQSSKTPTEELHSLRETLKYLSHLSSGCYTEDIPEDDIKRVKIFLKRLKISKICGPDISYKIQEKGIQKIEEATYYLENFVS